MKWLAVLDTLGIHEYVFSTNLLTQMRGASALLNQCTVNAWSRAVKQPYGGMRIFCGGGNAQAIFPTAEAAQAYCRYAKEVLRRRTGSAIAARWVEEACDGEAFPGGLGGILDRAMANLDREKHSGQGPAWMDWNAYARFCDVCGVESAVSLLPEDTWVCGGCRAKDRRKGYWFRSFRKWISSKSFAGRWRDFAEPEHLNQIGELSHPSGYLAFVYLDVNQMGRWIRSADCLDAYSKMSLAVSAGIRDAVMEGLARCLVPQSPAGGARPIAPFEIFLMGGDEAVLAVPAHVAADFAEVLFEVFDLAMAGSGSPRPLTLSVGVVFAHARFPVRLAVDRCCELLKSCKARAHALPEPQHVIDYMSATAAIEGPVRQARETQFVSTDGRALFSRPFTRAEFRSLRELSSILRDLPRNKIHEIYDLAFGNQYQAVMDYCYWLTRLDADLRDRLAGQFARWGLLASPFDSHGKTPVLDAIELAAFGG